MAGSGPAPKPARRRRNEDTYSDVSKTVVDDGEIVGPALGAGDWSPDTRSWWEIWRRSPQAKTFIETDWVRLRDIASLREAFYRKPTALLFAEIRQNESLLGATYVDRLKGRIKVTKQAEASSSDENAAGVTAINEYKKRLAAG